MKIRIEVVGDLPEDEVLIRCGRVDETIREIHQFILERSSSGAKILFYKENQEYYFPLDEILFFETDGEYVYAHTKNDAYRVKYRLYELETILPRDFIRVSKSTIINSAQVYSISRNLTASSLVQFHNSHKQVYVSRHYFQDLRRRIDERSHYEN